MEEKFQGFLFSPFNQKNPSSHRVGTPRGGILSFQVHVLQLCTQDLGKSTTEWVCGWIRPTVSQRLQLRVHLLLDYKSPTTVSQSCVLDAQELVTIPSQCLTVSERFEDCTVTPANGPGSIQIRLGGRFTKPSCKNAAGSLLKGTSVPFSQEALGLLMDLDLETGDSTPVFGQTYRFLLHRLRNALTGCPSILFQGTLWSTSYHQRLWIWDPCLAEEVVTTVHWIVETSAGLLWGRTGAQLLGGRGSKGRIGQGMACRKFFPECQWATPRGQEPAHGNEDDRLLEAARGSCCWTHPLEASWSTHRIHGESGCRSATKAC